MSTVEGSPAVKDERVTLVLDGRELDPFREILRQQLLGDQELLRDAVAGREDPEIRLHVYDRMQLTRRLMAEVGGIEVVERRRVSSRETGYLRLPISLLVVLLGIVLSTVGVYTAYEVGLGALPVIYLPVLSYATLRHGKRASILTMIGSVAAYLALDPLSLGHVARGAITLAAMLFALWLIRRDVF